MNALVGRKAKSNLALRPLIFLGCPDDRSGQDGGDFGGTRASGHAIGMFEWSGCHGRRVRWLLFETGNHCDGHSGDAPSRDFKGLRVVASDCEIRAKFFLSDGDFPATMVKP